MRIVFINPPFLKNFSRSQRSPAVTKGGTVYYPYFLAYAAGWAQKNGFIVDLFDFVAEELTFAEAIKKVKQFQPGLIVIETSTASIYSDIKFVRQIKRKLPMSFILLVGTHVSALPEWTLEQAKEIDGVVVGEYDQTVVDLANFLSLRGPIRSDRSNLSSTGSKREIATSKTSRDDNNFSSNSLFSVDGLVFRSGNKIIRNKPRALIKNLDQLPFVSSIYTQFLDIKKYYFAAADFPMVMIIGGRGCPYGCSFCLYPQTMHGLGFRARSAQNLAEEFVYIKKNLPQVKEIVLEDDTFTADPSRVAEFCRLLLKFHPRGGKGMTPRENIKWSANVRVGLDLKTMKLMKKAGCRLVIVGYESGSEAVLRGMNKKIKTSDSLMFAKNAKKAGLLVHGCFVVGNPGETVQTMQQTLDLAKKLDPDSAQFYPLFVYPGTKAYSWAKENGYLITKDYSKWLKSDGSHNCVIDLPGLSAKQMMAFCDEAYRKFHLRPKYLLKKVIQLVASPSEGVRSARSGVKYLINLILINLDNH